MARPTILSLFSGVGGLDLGIKIALPGSRVLGYVERDAYAAAVLLARMEDSSLEPAPVWCGDIQDLCGSNLPGPVDIICGGFPCQDISVAGKGVGISGKRSGLWSEIVRLADEIRPRYLFLENVSAIVTRGLDAVLADLAALGFDAEWLCLRASDVGAPHRRERWFCLAYCNGEQRRSNGREPHPAPNWRDNAWRCGEMVDNSSGAGTRLEEHRGGGPGRQPAGTLAAEVLRQGDWAGSPEGADAAERAVAHAQSRGARRVGSAQESDGEHRCTRTGSDCLDDPPLERPQGQHPAGAAAGAVERAGGDGRRPLDDAELVGDVQLEAEPLRAGWATADVAGRPFPPGPADHDAWRAVLEQHPHLAPAVERPFRRVVNGMADRLDGGLSVRTEHGPQTSAKSDFDRWFRMCQVRLAEITGEAPPELRRSTECGSSMSSLPCAGTSGSPNADVSGVWQRDHKNEPSISEEHLQLPWVPQRMGSSVRFEAVGKDMSRADQLRCAGNGVVPLQAAVAFRELMTRIING